MRITGILMLLMLLSQMFSEDICTVVMEDKDARAHGILIIDGRDLGRGVLTVSIQGNSKNPMARVGAVVGSLTVAKKEGQVFQVLVDLHGKPKGFFSTADGSLIATIGLSTTPALEPVGLQIDQASLSFFVWHEAPLESGMKYRAVHLTLSDKCMRPSGQK